MFAPLCTICTWLIVTLEAAIFRLLVSDSPDSTAPFPSTSTQPRGSQCQPVPLETWPGTVFRAIPDGTPVFVASGKPQTLGLAAQLLGVVAACPAGDRYETLTKPAAATKAPVTPRTAISRLRPCRRGRGLGAGAGTVVAGCVGVLRLGGHDISFFP